MFTNVPYEEKTITFTAEEISLIREDFFNKLLNFDVIEYYRTDQVITRSDGKLIELIAPIDPSLYAKKKCIENIVNKLDS